VLTTSSQDASRVAEIPGCAVLAPRCLPGETDWTAYYSYVPITARLTRRYSGRVLVRLIRDATRICGPVQEIVELGGANSCFLWKICRSLLPDRYLVIDRNQYGLSLLDGWTAPPPALTTLSVREADVRTPEPGSAADLVFSVGLIEHFNPIETRNVVRAHFERVRRGGIVLVSYPTPTWLYRASRAVLERAGLWRFPDERPLEFAEIANASGDLGEVIARRTLWPLFLTQEMVVFRKR
jgi:hypothetical protein